MAHLTPKPTLFLPAHVWVLGAVAWVVVLSVVGLFAALCG